jgi:tRNA (guanine37-N1)-methyltransferase
MMYEPLRKAIRNAVSTMGEGSRVVAMTPQGRRLDQDGAARLARCGRLVIVAGRYEGMDERLIEAAVDEEWSVGDFVLSGGEIAAMVLIDAMIRLLPGALGDQESSYHESFFSGLLDYPSFTRPEAVEGHRVPALLLSGNHEAIRRWRLKQGLGRTWLRRPDMLRDRPLDTGEQALLEEFLSEQGTGGQ